MTTARLRYLKAHLRKYYNEFIDLSDLDEPTEANFLTRALSAFCLKHFAAIDPSEAAAHVIDSSGDNGIDAIYYKNERLYIVQAKWITGGKKTIESGDMHKFISGLKDLWNRNLKNFNPKAPQASELILKIAPKIDSPRTKTVLIVAFTSTNEISANVVKILDNLISDMRRNQTDVEKQILNLKSLYSILESSNIQEPINIDVELHNWSRIDQPYTAYVGQVKAVDVASWYEEFGDRLIDANLRKFLGPTPVNQAMCATLTKEPHHFWYLNNGITVLFHDYQAAPSAAINHNRTKIAFKQAQIVNGAQTLWAISQMNKDSRGRLANALVSVRFISLQGCPDGFFALLTRATNRQNKISNREFVALHELQSIIRSILRQNGIDYAYQQGEVLKDKSRGFDLDEATETLACFSDTVDYAITAGREIEELWSNIEKQPYHVLFHEALDPLELWKKVQALRIVKDVLEHERDDYTPRGQVIRHGRYVIAYDVFRRTLQDSDFINLDEIEDIKEEIEESTRKSIEYVHEAYTELYDGELISGLFKDPDTGRRLAAFAAHKWVSPDNQDLINQINEDLR